VYRQIYWYTAHACVHAAVNYSVLSAGSFSSVPGPVDGTPEAERDGSRRKQRQGSPPRCCIHRVRRQSSVSASISHPAEKTAGAQNTHTGQSKYLSLVAFPRFLLARPLGLGRLKVLLQTPARPNRVVCFSYRPSLAADMQHAAGKAVRPAGDSTSSPTRMAAAGAHCQSRCLCPMLRSVRGQRLPGTGVLGHVKVRTCTMQLPWPRKAFENHLGDTN
jgi:hypothetical protein